jgi:hypothetical protein
MTAKHCQPNQSHLTRERSFKTLLELRNLARVKRVDYCQ